MVIGTNRIAEHRMLAFFLFFLQRLIPQMDCACVIKRLEAYLCMFYSIYKLALSLWSNRTAEPARAGHAYAEMRAGTAWEMLSAFVHYRHCKHFVCASPIVVEQKVKGEKKNSTFSLFLFCSQANSNGSASQLIAMNFGP